jgi:hypothetical protein
MAATRYTTHLHQPPAATWGRRRSIDSGTIVLGTVLSTLAAIVAVVMATLGDVSQWSLALSVAIIGFVSSWVRSAPAANRRPVIVTISH